jgi:hypothetical protein
MIGIILTMGSTTDMLAYVGNLFSDIWVFIAIIIGIPLAFYIIGRIIGLTSPSSDIEQFEKWKREHGE